MKRLAEASVEYPASARLLETASRYRELYVSSHDNPDPDAIASGWAIVHLFETVLGRPCRFTAGGEILRAENRKLIALLRPPLILGGPITPSRESLLVLVDCDVDSTNHPKIDVAEQPVAVIDHHLRERSPRLRVVFQDRRSAVAATCSIAASYLKEQGINPPEPLATALIYGIRTETRGGETRYSELDHAMLSWVTGLGNPSLVAEIEEAPHTLAYYSDLALGLQNTFLYGDTAFCILPQSQGPELAGEVADLLLRSESIHHVFCAALYGGRLLVSVRMQGADANAARTVKQVLRGVGYGGGHPHRAGGVVKRVPSDRESLSALYRELRRRWLSACDAREKRGARLVSRASILKSLLGGRP